MPLEPRNSVTRQPEIQPHALAPRWKQTDCETSHPSYSFRMKTATLQELPSQWTDILRWVTAGEEVQIMDHDKTVA